MAPRTAAPATRQHADDRFDLEALPDELLARVIRAVGLQEALKRLLVLLGSSRLHRVWQAEVRSVSIKFQELAASDSAIIARYGAELEGLAFWSTD